eukprot:581252-Pelagomonas_calceolata.AAC.3
MAFNMIKLSLDMTPGGMGAAKKLGTFLLLICCSTAQVYRTATEGGVLVNILTLTLQFMGCKIHQVRKRCRCLRQIAYGGQRGAAQVLRRLLQDWTDEDLRLGASQLLGTIGSAAVAPSSKPSLATDGDGGGGGGGGGGGANGNEGSSIASLETGAAAAAANGGGSMDGVAAQQQQQQQQQQQRLATLNAQLQDGMELLSSVVASKGLASFADPRGCSIPDAPKVIRNIAC